MTLWLTTTTQHHERTLNCRSLVGGGDTSKFEVQSLLSYHSQEIVSRAIMYAGALCLSQLLALTTISLLQRENLGYSSITYSTLLSLPQPVCSVPVLPPGLCCNCFRSPYPLLFSQSIHNMLGLHPHPQEGKKGGRKGRREGERAGGRKKNAASPAFPFQ